MSPRQFLRRMSDSLLGTEFDRAMRRARRTRSPRFLFCWNRGLGDVGLGLSPLIGSIRRDFADARIEALTREDAVPAFELAGVDAIHAVPGLARGTRAELRAEATRLGLDAAAYTWIFADPDPRRWMGTGREFPAARLRWQPRFDRLAGRFPELAAPGPWVVVHFQSETSQFYRYPKDWPPDRWAPLFDRVRAVVPARFVLLAAAPGAPVDGEGIVDLRGRATLLESLSVIVTRANALVAPDSGILSLTYLLDAQRELDVVSLWSDPRQGVLKLATPSPNRRLRHFPILGRDENVTNITADEVARQLLSCLGGPGGGDAAGKVAVASA
jgi:hypothetical protein